METPKKSSRFEDLQVWKNATKIGVDVFNLTDGTNFKGDFGVKDQLRRSAFSISSNIAEGIEYDNDKDLIKFLRYAKGSAGELRSQLFIISQAGIISQEKYDSFYDELIGISKQLSGFIRFLRKRQ